MHLVAKHGIEPDVFQSGDFVLSLHREGQIPKLLKFWLIILLTRASSIGATLAPMTSLPIQDGGPHDFRSKMAAPMTPRWRPPRNQDGGPL